MLEEGLATFKELGDKPGAANLLANLGAAVVHGDNDHRRVTALRDEAEALRPELVDRPVIAHLLIFLGLAAVDEGDHDRAVARLEESLALNRELGDRRGVAMSISCLGLTELSRGDHERAAAPFEEALRLLQGRGDRVGIAYSLLGLAGVAGEPARAARLWGASEALREAVGLPLTPFARHHSDYEGSLAVARARLDEQSFAAAWSEGRAMTPEQAIEYALSEEEPPTLVPVVELAATGGKTHPPRARGRHPRRAGVHQPPDRRRAGDFRAYGRDPRPQDPQKAGAALSRPDLHPDLDQKYST